MEKRLWFVDNLRVLLTVLVVLHHVAVTYSGMGLWYYTEEPTSGAVALGLTVFLLVNQAWFMGAFFLLSGYFTPASYDRKGPRAFLRDRLIRLGIPLLVFYFVLNPILYVGSNTSYLHSIGSGPLWFVFALLVFDGSYAAYRHFTGSRRLRGSGALTYRAVIGFVFALLVFDGSYVAFRHFTGNRRLRGSGALTYRAVIGFVVALALGTYALRIVVPMGTWVPVIDFPTSTYLPQYVSFFVLGIVAYRRDWLSTITPAMGRVGLGLAIGATLVFLPLALVLGADAWVGHGTLSSLFYALWDSTFAVGLVLALVTFFRRRFTTQGPLGRYLSRHAFTVYMIHAFVVIAAARALSVVEVPTLAKFVIAAVVVLPVCFLLAGPVRRLPGVRAVL